MKRSYFSLVIIMSIILLSHGRMLAQENQKTIDQIQLLLQEKKSRTPAQQKISSQLLQAVREHRGEKMVDGATLNAAIVSADLKGSLIIDMKARASDSLLLAIQKLGGSIIFFSEKYGAVRAKVNLSDIEKIAALDGVNFIEPAIKASVLGAGQSAASNKANDDSKPLLKTNKNRLSTIRYPSLKERKQHIQHQLERYLNAGTVNSQGDHAHRADDVRTTYGAQGQGIRIGILSDSYNATGGATADVYNGNLPGTGNPNGFTTPVTVLAEDSFGTDEGRAMLQIVHDLAPKAQLFFATADNGDASFATNILALRNTYNCDIIIDDIFYFNEPQFQDGIIAQAVNTVTASGALYFSAAGNEGSVAKGTAGIYEGDFKDAGSLAFIGSTKLGSIHNWGSVAVPINGNIITSGGQYYGLNWSDPFYASSNDYDLFLISSTGIVKASSTNLQTGTQQAFEGFNAVNFDIGDRLVVFKSAGAQVRAFSLNTFKGKLTTATTGQTHGHSASANAFSVASASAMQTNGAPFSAGNVVENNSSDGLRRIFYNADNTPVTPSNILFATNGGMVRNKPDITAADNVSTSLPFNSNINPLFGTSAAAAHAGAIAALIKSIKPSTTTAQMRTALTSTALDIESVGYDNVSGYGIVQAFQAMQSLNPTLVSDVSLANFTPVEGLGSNNNGGVDPGESIKLVVNFKNTSPITATGVTGTLSTSTTGIAIATPTSNYGNLSAANSADNSSAPFVFNVDGSVACGTQINFTLTLNFGNGVTSSQTFPLVVTVGNQPIINISGSLGTPSASTGLYTSSTGIQIGRINRFSIISACGTSKSNPGLASTTGNRTYDAYVFTNKSNITQCVTVTFSSVSGTNLYTVAYNNNGFIPATPNVNFVADYGTSSNAQSFSFNVNAGEKYTITVLEVNPATAINTPYNLNINSNACSGVVLPITWLNFTAIEERGQVALKWKVANELNVDHYEVEHSVDGNLFTKIYSLPASEGAAPEKDYSRIHSFPAQGKNYYRIREIDVDGRFTISKTVLVNLDKPNTIVVAPTIASSFVSVQSKYIIDGIKLLNATGQLVMNIAPAVATYNLQINNLPAGLYYLHITIGNETTLQKIIKKN